MSDGDALVGGLPFEFESAIKKLNRLFAGALGDVKLRSCGAAWSEIRRAKSAKKKREILNKKAQEWREDSGKAIREWFPKFVDLAAAFGEAIHGDALQWATDTVWEMVEKQYGIRRPKPDEPKSPDSISRTMVFWFAAASEGNTDVNLLPLQPWKAPAWLARGDEQRDSLLKEHTGNLSLRLNHIIKEEIDAAEIRRAISHREVTGRIVEGGIRKRDGESPAQFEPLRRSLRQSHPEDAKPLRFGVPNSIDLEIWKQLDPHTNRLTRLRVEKARNKYRREAEAETRQIHFDNRGNANSMAIPYALLRMQLKKADEFAEQQYSIFRDVWLRLGGVESAAFIRTISWMGIQRPFDARGASVAHEEKRRFRGSGGLHPGLSPETIRKGFDDLKTEWRDKLEIKASEWEAEAQGMAPALEHTSWAGGVPKSDEVSRPPQPVFVHSLDYRTITFKSIGYVLTSNQALIVQLLHEALQKGLRGVSTTTLLSRLGNPRSRLRDSFRSGDGPRLWKILIVKVPATKDMYTLSYAGPFPTDSRQRYSVAL